VSAAHSTVGQFGRSASLVWLRLRTLSEAKQSKAALAVSAPRKWRSIQRRSSCSSQITRSQGNQSADHPKPLEQTDPKGNPNGRNRPAKSNTIRPLGCQPCRAGYSAGLPQRVLRSAAPPDLCAVHSVAALLSLSLGVAYAGAWRSSTSAAQSCSSQAVRRTLQSRMRTRCVRASRSSPRAYLAA
jgi:hypothetical protein